MLTAQLKCNPLYPTAWQNNRNITNQRGEGATRELVKDPELAPRPPPPLPPGTEQAGRKASICGIIDPLEEGDGDKYYFKKKKGIQLWGGHVRAPCCFYGNTLNWEES